MFFPLVADTERHRQTPDDSCGFHASIFFMARMPPPWRAQLRISGCPLKLGGTVANNGTHAAADTPALRELLGSTLERLKLIVVKGGYKVTMVPVSRACANNLYEKREQQYDDANKYTTEQFLVLRKNLAHVLSGTTTPAHSLSSHPHVEVQVCCDFPSPGTTTLLLAPVFPTWEWVMHRVAPDTRSSKRISLEEMSNNYDKFAKDTARMAGGVSTWFTTVHMRLLCTLLACEASWCRWEG